MNKYIGNGDGTVTLLLGRRDGSIMEALIDESDLQKLMDYGATWSVAESNHKEGLFYVSGWNKELKRPITLHRFLMSPPEGMVVDHRDGNPLNCRRSNMRVCTQAENLQNRQGARKDNKTSSYRGVSFYKPTGKWHVQVQKESKHYHGGYFDTPEEANEAAIALRMKLFTHSDGR